jgi:hypothetical protein
MPLTASSGARAPIVLTSEQARILYDLVMVNGALLQARWSHGIWSGLLDALLWIEVAGGAYVDNQRNPLTPPPRADVPHGTSL